MPKPKISPQEQERRQAILRDVAKRVQCDGTHIAQPHANRARQFMPFAALKGYHELAHKQERTLEPRHEMTDEVAAELSAHVAQLQKGDMVRITHYEEDGYVTTQGVVTKVDYTFHALQVVQKHIDFEDMAAIEKIDKP